MCSCYLNLKQTKQKKERGLTSAWNHNTLSLQYKLDNEFELVFVVAYQNIIKLAYIDKFLNEMQLRFRDKYKTEIQNGHFHHDFSGFKADFNAVLKECEEEARLASVQNQKKPRGYNESDKSTRTVASMIETKKPGFLSNLVSSATSSGPSSTQQTNTSKADVAKPSVKENKENNADADSGCEAGSDGVNAFGGDDSIKRQVILGENGAIKKIGGKPKKFEAKKLDFRRTQYTI